MIFFLKNLKCFLYTPAKSIVNRGGGKSSLPDLKRLNKKSKSLSPFSSYTGGRVDLKNIQK